MSRIFMSTFAAMSIDLSLAQALSFYESQLHFDLTRIPVMCNVFYVLC